MAQSGDKVRGGATEAGKAIAGQQRTIGIHIPGDRGRPVLPAGEDVGVLLPEPNIHVLHAGLTTLAEDEIAGRTDVTNQVAVVVDNRLHGSACGGSGEGTDLDGLVANQGLRMRLRTEVEDVAASADLA